MLTPQHVTDVATVVLASQGSIAALRERFPDLHFTECSEDDVITRVQPATETPAHYVYLVSGATGHCLSLTGDLALATGFLIAAKVDDE